MRNDYKHIQLLKDINERNEIVQKYLATGFLDRDEAIFKIKELRNLDETVAEVTTAKLAQGTTPFSIASDEQIIEELKMQICILNVKQLINSDL